MKRLLWLFLITSVSAQIQGNLPDLVDSLPSQLPSFTDYQVPMPNGVSSGQLIDVCVLYDTAGAASTSAFPVTDTLGNTYTTTTPALTPVGFSHIQTAVYHAYTVSGGTGANTITVALPASTRYAMGYGRFTGLSGTLDGSLQNATQTSPGPQTVSTTSTTTTNGSVGSSCTGTDSYSGGRIATGNSEYVIANQCVYPGCAFNLMQSYLHTGAAGSQVLTENLYLQSGFGSNAYAAKQTIFFKPSSTIAITDTQMPECAVGVYCEMSLHSVGGTAALTYSIFSGSLPTGLSLTAGTGKISGTPSGSPGTSTVTAKVTDGIVTSPASPSLSIKVNAAFNTPSVAQIQHANNELFGASDFITFPGVALCGQVVMISYYGSDAHGVVGWVNATAGSLENITDTLGTVYTRIGPVIGSNNAAQVVWVGQITSSGPLTVHVTPAIGSGLHWTGRVINNVQPTVDRGIAITGGMSVSTPVTFNTALTTLVPNTYVAASTNSTMDNSGNVDTYSYSPITVDVQDYGVTASTAAGGTLIASPSLFTLTTTATVAAPAIANPVSSLFGFRPAATFSGACSVSLGQDLEKFRRQIW